MPDAWYEALLTAAQESDGASKRPPPFHMPLYFLRVAILPRMCCSALLSSSSERT